MKILEILIAISFILIVMFGSIYLSGYLIKEPNKPTMLSDVLKMGTLLLMLGALVLITASCFVPHKSIYESNKTTK